MGNDQVYLTLISILSGASSILASIVVAVMMNFTKQTREKFTSVFNKVEAITDRIADEETDRKVREAQLVGKLELYDQNVNHVKRRIYDLSDTVTELKCKVDKIERNGTVSQKTGLQ